MELKIGFSPCPNDTFMFNALVNGVIDTGDLKLIPVIADVEQLNKLALNGELDVTKLSLNAFAFASQHYQILNAGSALGYNCGPLLVSKSKFSVSDLAKCRTAIPGKYTTANLLLSIFFPEVKEKTEIVFSEIESAVLSGNVHAGLLIHENRFTYMQRGLHKIVDLGEVWHEQTGMPIPLGCIAIKKNLGKEIKSKVDKLISESVMMAFRNPEQTMPYVKQHAQEMSEEVMIQHIKLYVTASSVDMKMEGRNAIEFLLRKGNELNLLPAVENIFIELNSAVTINK
jgi:1,4-dihydroxy-6-naphthoate synthase